MDTPFEGSEASCNLNPGTGAGKWDQLLAQHRLTNFLRRVVQRPPQEAKAWTDRFDVD